MVPSARRRLILALALLALGGGGVALAGRALLRRYVYPRLMPAPMAPMEAPAGVGSRSAAVCAACHAEIAAEWAGSRMGRAMKDPVFLADFANQGGFYCYRCHSPLHEQQPTRVSGLRATQPLTHIEAPNPDYDQELQSEGVTCVACHWREGAMVAGIADPQGAPHPTHADAEEVGVSACARCHEVPAPPLTGLDRPLPDTLAEWACWKEITGRTERCTDCHMSTVERAVATGAPTRSSHRHDFPGGWDEALLHTAATVLSAAVEADGVRVSLRNDAGHALPTGEPSRALVLSATARLGDASLATGEQVFARVVPVPRMRDQALDPAGVQRSPVPDPALRFVETHRRIVRQDPFLVGLGAVGPGHEWAIPKMFEAIIPGLRRAGFSESEIGYFTLHVEQDGDHGAWLEEALARQATTDEARAQIRRGALASLEARGAFWDGVQAAIVRWRQPRTIRQDPRAPRGIARELMATALAGVGPLRRLSTRLVALKAARNPDIPTLLARARELGP